MKNVTKLKAILFFLMLLPTLVINAQTAPAGQSLLWKISGNGLKKDSYFLLTASNVCADMGSLDKKTAAALADAQNISVESGINNPDNQPVIKRLIQVKDQSQSMKKVLSNGLYTQLATEAANVGMNEVTLNNFKPIYICGLIVKVVNPCEVPNAKTTETLVRNYAHDKNIKVGELLSQEENFITLDAYPNTYWEKTVDFLINDSADAVNDLDNKTEFYKHDNLRGVIATMNKSPLFKLKYAYPDIESKRMSLLSSRIENTIKNQSSVILIDIANIANPSTSVFAQLTKAGYNISAVN
jgi:uncharacterized protein YbaP (TraB family)